MTYLSHWIPTFAGAGVLAVAGVILWVINYRKDVAAARQPPRVRPEAREEHTGT